MVRTQSSWFPIYDRNLRTWVENIAMAKPGDYQAATHRIWLRGDAASFIELPMAAR